MKERGARGMRGLTLIETVVLLVILSIVALGAGVGLQSVSKVPSQTDALLAVGSQMVNVMEQMKAEPWGTMSTKASALTNTAPGVLINGKYYACTVSVTDVDADSDGDLDADFRQITVTIGGQTMNTCVMQP